MHFLYLAPKRFRSCFERNLIADSGKGLLIILIFQFLRLAGYGQPGVFVDVSKQQFSALPQLRNSSSAWGDYDKDGRPDLLLCGVNNSDVPVTKLYHNTTSGFVDVSNLVPNIPQVSSGALTWGRL